MRYTVRIVQKEMRKKTLIRGRTCTAASLKVRQFIHIESRADPALEKGGGVISFLFIFRLTDFGKSFYIKGKFKRHRGSDARVCLYSKSAGVFHV